MDKHASDKFMPGTAGAPGITYSSYLKVSDLIALQHPASNPAAHDEMLFIVIHQVYELWFKQILFELDALIVKLEKNELISAFRMMNRVCEIFEVLVKQVDILETMTPVEFNRFRSHLNPASGFQSFQFRELELLAGRDIADMAKLLALEPEWKAKLEARASRKSLREAFLQLLEERYMLTDRTPEKLLAALLKIYDEKKPDLPLQTLCENLIHFDELVTMWRFRHVQMVERMIGQKPGTGGSLGVSYLQNTLRIRFFPELWQVRTMMNGSQSY